MGIGNIFKMFQPKDKVFFVLFEKVAEELVEMSKEFHESLLDFDINDDTMLQHMSDYEHRMDDLTHEIFVQLGENFITPFDREDISHLASGLDDIADYMYASMKKINFYHVNPDDIGIKKFGDLIALGTVQVHKAVTELRNMKDMRKITDALVAINSIENQGDDIFDMSIERLFASEPDAKEVIKKREIYQVMEIVTDKCEDAANVIESIIIKYA